MIPKNITREHVLKVIEEIERNGIPSGRNSRKFILSYEGKSFPPKYVVSLANKYANGVMLDSSKFSGGQETNHFLRSLGFRIRCSQFHCSWVFPNSINRNCFCSNSCRVGRWSAGILQETQALS